MNVKAKLAAQEPLSYNETINSNDIDKWKEAMEEKMNSLPKNRTWELVVKPQNLKLVGCKWIFKLKHGQDPSQLVRYKAKLVAKGFT